MQFPNPTGALDYFPETYFPPADRYAEKYYETREAGRVVMAEKSVVITGLARNVGQVLHKTIARVVHIGNMFKACHVVIYENDSEDDTLDRLKEWEKCNSNVTVISHKLGDPINPGSRDLGRAARMARYRNTCREHIAENFSDLDYAIILDTDIQVGYSYDGIASTFGQAEPWDFVGSNGIIFRSYRGIKNRPIHFDVWAFRWFGSYKPTAASKINPRHWQRGEPMHPLFSCFGGLGIYKMAAFKSGWYDGSDCEHVPFHRRLREAGFGKIFMNPSQVVVY